MDENKTEDASEVGSNDNFCSWSIPNTYAFLLKMKESLNVLNVSMFVIGTICFVCYKTLLEVVE